MYSRSGMDVSNTWEAGSLSCCVWGLKKSMQDGQSTRIGNNVGHCVFLGNVSSLAKAESISLQLS